MWKLNIIGRNVKICKMIKSGENVEDVSIKFNLSKKTIYSIIKKNNVNSPRTLKTLSKKTNVKKSMTPWTNKIFLDIKKISLKYQKILSMKGFNIDHSDIEATLLDLMIHTDQKDIKNKDAYFRKYSPLKISNLRDKMVKRAGCSLFNNRGEELFSGGINPESEYIIYEKLNKTTK